MAASDGGDLYPLSPNNEDSSIPSSNNNVAPPSPPKGPVVCLVSSLCDGAGGGLLGSVFGLGQGLWKRQGFKVALKEAGTSAKTFAILSGVHTLVTCFLRTIRGKHDAINAGIAGCATGLVLGMPGTPDSLLRSCVTFGAFSYIIERFNKPQAALASDLDSSLVKRGRIGDYSPLFSLCVLPPFVLPPAYPGSIMPSRSKHLLEYTSRRV